MAWSRGRLNASVFALGALSASLAVFMLRGGTVSEDSAPPSPLPGRVSAAPAAVVFEPAADHGASGFVVRGEGFSARLGPDGARFRLRDAAGSYARAGFRLLDANAAAAGAGTDPLPGRSHYYRGNDPADWRVNVPQYGRVSYASVYPGIDMAYHSERGGLEFDFILAPGANPAPIRLILDDGDRPARLDAAGDLLLPVAAGELRLRRPVAYQERPGRREPVEAAFELDATGRVLGFRLGGYDTSRRLIIDPVIAYADYLGGGGDDRGLALAVDADGNRYVSGGTASVDFADDAKAANTGMDAFVAKLAPDGTRLYVTFIEGNGEDRANAIAVDSGGEAYIAGDTASGNLASSGGAVQPGYGGSGDAFVARLGTDGTLEFLSYLGGAAQDNGRAIALSAAGDMIVGGSTLSDNFPLQNALQSARSGQSDGFIARIDSTGAALVYSTYHGGAGPDNVAALAVDETGAVYFGGTTGSDNFPTTPGAYQEDFQRGGSDGYVTKLAPDGATRVYSTYLGGSNTDGVLALAVDSNHYAYVTGYTSSSFNFPATDGTPLYAGGTFDAFVTRMIPSGAVPDYSTFLGGSGEDQGQAIALSDGDPVQVVVAGFTESDDLPLIQPFQVERLGGEDGFVTQFQFAPSAVSRVFSTYLGGTGDDAIAAVGAGSTEIIHVAGTGGANLPVVLPVQDGNAGGADAFVMRLERDLSQPLPNLTVSVDADPTPVSRRKNVEFSIRVDNAGAGAASGVLVRVDGTNFSSLVSPTVGCQAGAGISLLCDAGGVNPLGFGAFEIRAVPDQIGDVTLTATLLRADQSGISAGENSSTLQRLVVDDSDQSAALFWEVFALAGAWPLLSLARRRVRRA